MRQVTVGWVERSVTQQVFSGVRLRDRDPQPTCSAIALDFVVFLIHEWK
ncbi:MAG: hypothetical protein F6J92_36220 [Symploca sp. SIO1A3]|nr:hypothetical protein [Symploca sp. SIO1A3]